MCKSEIESVKSYSHLVDTRILAIDDSNVNLYLYQGILSNIDCEVISALNGEEGLKLAKEAKPTLIILDIILPDIDGFEICKILKKNPDTTDIPIIIVTSLTGMEDLRRGFEFGAVDYIKKPVQGEELLIRVQACLKLLSLQAQLLEEQQKTAVLQMAGGVAHNFNQPLTVLSANLQMLKKQLDVAGMMKGQDVPDQIEMMEQSLKRITNLTRQLSNLTRFSTSEYPGEQKILDFGKSSS